MSSAAAENVTNTSHEDLLRRNELARREIEQLQLNISHLQRLQDIRERHAQEMEQLYQQHIQDLKTRLSELYVGNAKLRAEERSWKISKRMMSETLLKSEERYRELDFEMSEMTEQWKRLYDLVYNVSTDHLSRLFSSEFDTNARNLYFVLANIDPQMFSRIMEYRREIARSEGSESDYYDASDEGDDSFQSERGVTIAEEEDMAKRQSAKVRRRHKAKAKVEVRAKAEAKAEKKAIVKARAKSHEISPLTKTIRPRRLQRKDHKVSADDFQDLNDIDLPPSNLHCKQPSVSVTAYEQREAEDARIERPRTRMRRLFYNPTGLTVPMAYKERPPAHQVQLTNLVNQEKPRTLIRLTREELEEQVPTLQSRNHLEPLPISDRDFSGYHVATWALVRQAREIYLTTLLINFNYFYVEREHAATEPETRQEREDLLEAYRFAHRVIWVLIEVYRRDLAEIYRVRVRCQDDD